MATSTKFTIKVFNMYSIRKATLEDKDAIVALLAEMASESQYANFKTNREKMYTGLNYWIQAKDSDAILLVAENDGNVVGLIAASINEHWGTDSKFSHQDLYTVSKDHRKNGVGGELFNAFFSWAKNHVDHIHTSAFSGTGVGLDRICEKIGMVRAGSAYVWFSPD